MAQCAAAYRQAPHHVLLHHVRRYTHAFCNLLVAQSIAVLHDQNGACVLWQRRQLRGLEHSLLGAREESAARAAGAIAQLGNLGTTTGTPLLAFLVDLQFASLVTLLRRVTDGAYAPMQVQLTRLFLRWQMLSAMRSM